MGEAIIGAVGGLMGSIFGSTNNAASTERMNEQNIAFQREQNEINRKWQEEMYDKNNLYNSPTMTMQRYKAAGLNPHLIYGQGSNVAMPSAPAQTAPHVEKVERANYGEAVFRGIQNYVALKQQQTQIDNQKKAMDVMDADIAQKNAAAASSLSNSAKTDQDRQFASELFKTASAQAIANLNNTNLQTGKIQEEINNLIQSRAESGQRIKLSQAQIANIASEIGYRGQQVKMLRLEGRVKEADLILKNLDINLRRSGFNSSDPAWQRILMQSGAGTGVSDFLNHPIDTLKKGWDWLTNGKKWNE